MDASTIRLILIAIGAFIVLLLYLRERRRELQPEALDHDDAQAPNAQHADDRSPSAQAAWSDAEEDDDGSYDSANAAAPESSSAPPLVAGPTLEPILLQLSIIALGQPFPGPRVLAVAQSCGLHPGEGEIFHCMDEFPDGPRIYFSMANRFKPGTFPFADMEGFSTPGLVLYAQLAGDPEDMTVLDEMIASARRLAQSLHGEVLDEQRQPLTVRKEEQMREAVLANEARWARMSMR